MRSFVLTGCSGVASDLRRLRFRIGREEYSSRTGAVAPEAKRPCRVKGRLAPCGVPGGSAPSEPENFRPVRATAYGEHAVESRILFGIIAAAVDAAPAFPAFPAA